jgi:hypothetical protein
LAAQFPVLHPALEASGASDAEHVALRIGRPVDPAGDQVITRKISPTERIVCVVA